MLAGWPPPSEGTVREGLSVTPPPSPRALCVPAGLPNPEHTHTPKRKMASDSKGMQPDDISLTIPLFFLATIEPRW